MKIKSKISGRVQDVTAADWAMLKARGADKNFEVLSTSNTPAPSSEAPQAETPAEVETSGANFNTNLRRGQGAFKKGEYEEALTHYRAAQKIKDNNLIKGRIAEAEKALEAKQNRPAEESSEEK